MQQPPPPQQQPLPQPQATARATDLRKKLDESQKDLWIIKTIGHPMMQIQPVLSSIAYPKVQ
jgi:hypothetical protein